MATGKISLKKGAEEGKISVAKLFYYQVIPRVVGISHDARIIGCLLSRRLI